MKIRDKKRELGAWVMGMAFAAVSLTACQGRAGAAVSGQSVSEAEAGNILTVQMDVEVSSMDPQMVNEGTSFEVIAAYTEGLYSVDAQGNAIPAIAESVEERPDGLGYTFRLREAHWSDGTPVTADDFVFAWRRAADPGTGSEYAFILETAGIRNAGSVARGEQPLEDLGVWAEDERTLVVELDRPVPYFLTLMSFPTFYPVNEAFYNSCEGRFASSPDTMLANGAFRVSGYEPAAFAVTMEKNDQYWDAPNVSLDGLKFQVVKDSQNAVLEYEQGYLDMTYLSGEQTERFEGSEELRHTMAGSLCYISPNLKVKGLDNINLRKALSLCYDREAITNILLKDGSVPASHVVPANLATGPDGKDFREAAGSYGQYDRAQAAAYWELAKQELGVEQMVFTLLSDDTESSGNVAQFLQAEIQTTLPGITIEIQQMPKKTRVERMRQGDYELALTRWGPDYADPMTFLEMWVTDGFNNYGAWSSPEYDSLIRSAYGGELAADKEKRWLALAEAERMLVEEAVIFPIYERGMAILIKPGVEGVEFHTVGVSRIYKNARLYNHHGKQ